MLLKMEGEMIPNTRCSGNNKFHLSQHRADGKEYSLLNICMAVPAVPGRDNIREEWFVCTCGFKGLHSF